MGEVEARAFPERLLMNVEVASVCELTHRERDGAVRAEVDGREGYILADRAGAERRQRGDAGAAALVRVAGARVAIGRADLVGRAPHVVDGCEQTHTSMSGSASVSRLFCCVVLFADILPTPARRFHTSEGTLKASHSAVAPQLVSVRRQWRRTARKCARKLRSSVPGA